MIRYILFYHCFYDNFIEYRYVVLPYKYLNMAREPVSQKVLAFRVIFSILGFVVGTIAFFLWIFQFAKTERSYSIAGFGGFSGVISIWHGILHAMHFQDLWRTWLKGLKLFAHSGLLFLVACIASAIGFLIAAIIQKEGFHVNSYYVTSIWCLICSFYSILLFWFSRSYRNEFADLAAILEF